MNKVKIAHEAPIDILHKIAPITDYSYALVHLFETHPQYHQFFKNQLSQGREVILDNSIFELGEAFDTEKYAECIVELQPTEYIIPDVLEDVNGTVEKAEQWFREYKDLPGKKIGVVQGKSYGELRACYKILHRLGVDKIAISFDYLYYQDRLQYHMELTEEIDRQMQLMLWATGRPALLREFLRAGVIDTNMPHHLLGCSLPQEFKQYTGSRWDWIESLDTSNPVVAGIHFIEYDDDNGLSNKPSMKLFELIDHKVTAAEFNRIVGNIAKFRANCIG
jgi:hypothetical protein